MDSFNICLAGIPVHVDCSYSYLKEFCEEYLSQKAPEVTISISKEDILFERIKADFSYKTVSGNIEEHIDEYLETLALCRKAALIMLEYETLLIHGSVVVKDKCGYLFMAPAGTGKTTHSMLWEKLFPDAYILSGDKPLIKIDDSGITAYGTPWRGKEKYGRNDSASLKAICILERDITNHIERISFEEASPILYQQVYKPEDKLNILTVLKLLNKMDKRIKFYRLGCNTDDEAAYTSMLGMRDDND